jgi:hypothetical protein
MIFLRVMGFIEYQEVDLFHSDMGMQQALVQNLRRTNNNHIFLEKLSPSLATPEVKTKSSKYATNIHIKIIPQDSCLFVGKGDAINLSSILA